MTKADLIEEVSRVVEMTRKDSEVIVEAIFDSIVRSLRAGDKIEIRGYGSFRPLQRQPRVGREPLQAHSVVQAEQGIEGPGKRIHCDARARCSGCRFRRLTDRISSAPVN